ncbi:type 2 lanthipeptide synthetase LanM family protein [Actinokineospora sp.]|uniref:type 2 lanthipeptide synthetase LanM family protein n=1 Tax=Actinokineospora sp. TaxID=1872133 RepID=UPI004037DD12
MSESSQTDMSRSPAAPSWWTAGLAVAERPLGQDDAGDRTIRPEWSVFVEQVLAAESTGTRAYPAAVDDDVDVLAPALHQFTVAVAERIAEGASVLVADARLDLDPIVVGIGAQLGHRLATLAGRTLVSELHRTATVLSGETAADRFQDFLRRAATPAALCALFQTYPVLARLIGQACLQAERAVLELLARFADDRAEIVATLLDGTDPGALVEVRTGLGDRHRGGRSVTALVFADGRGVVYKPRPLDLHVRFNDLVAWLNDHVPTLVVRTAACLHRPGYGWMERIEHADCADATGIERFYRRQGALLALLYAVDATDIHHENVIAAGDQPVLVDVETLFQPVFPPSASTGHDPAVAALSSSVGRTALLPSMIFGEHGMLDISGLGGDRDTLYPSEATRWADAGLDTMHLVRRPVVFDGSANRPTIDGAQADPADHLTALLAGFRLAYNAIVVHRAELRSFLPRFADDEIRVIARHTHVYAKLLTESTHPDLLRDGVSRERVFEELWAQPLHDRLACLPSFEAADMWAGDVPTFYTRPGTRDLWTAAGERLRDVLEQPGLDTVAIKVAGMGELDRHDQEWLITATLASRLSTVEHRSADLLPGPLVAVEADPDRFLSLACGIADDIAARAAHDDTRANWTGMEPLDDRFWTVLPMGAGLATGYCGVALFLAQLGKLTGVTRYLDLAAKAVRPVSGLVDRFAAEPELAQAAGCGGFAGIGGIAYALARLTNLLDDADIRACLATTVRASALADDPAALSVNDGSAGGLAAMLAVHAETGLPEAAALAATLADRVAEAELPAPAFDSFLHGPAGIGWALLRYAADTGSSRHAAAATAILAGAPSVAAEGNHGIDQGWCSGLAGVAAAWSHPLVSHADRRAAGMAATLAAAAPLRDSSLCHGELGVLLGLSAVAKAGHETAAVALARRSGRLLGTLDNHGPRCGTPSGVRTPGLLAGLAGIGYGLLHLGFAEDVPSVLLLEPAVSRL